jgi:hypothetical protein
VDNLDLHSYMTLTGVVIDAGVSERLILNHASDRRGADTITLNYWLVGTGRNNGGTALAVLLSFKRIEVLSRTRLHTDAMLLVNGLLARSTVAARPSTTNLCFIVMETVARLYAALTRT